MISLVKTPKEIDFCGNSLSFKVFGTNYIEAQGRRSAWLLNLINPSWSSGYFQFWDFEKEESFIISLSFRPDYEKNEVPFGMNNVAQIASEISRIYQFNKYYSCYESGGRLYIYTLEEVYLDINNLCAKPGDFSNFSVSPGVSPVYKDVYSIHVLLYVFSGNLPLVVSESEIYPDKKGEAELSLGDIIQAYFENSKPDLASTTITFNPLLRYKVSIAEKYLVNSVLRVNRSSQFTGWVMNGKLPFTEYPAYDFIQELNSNKFFLNSADNVEVWKGSIYFLNFYNPLASIETVLVKCKIYYTDLTNQTETVFSHQTIPDYGRVYRFNCSINSLGLDSFNPGKEIYKYEIWVEHQDASILCSPKTFKVIDKPLFALEFAYLNKYGVFENFFTNSKSNLVLQTKKDISKKPLASDYEASDFEYSENLTESFNEHELTTGSIHRTQAINFQDILVSKVLYVIEGGRYIACIIDQGNYDIIKDSEDIVSIKFTYRKAFDK